MAPELLAEATAFKTWLQRNGACVLPTKGQYEVCRWVGPAGDGVRIVFTNKRGESVTAFGSDDARRDWFNFKDDTGAPAEEVAAESTATSRMLEKAPEMLAMLEHIDGMSDLEIATDGFPGLSALIKYIKEGNTHD